MDQEEKNNPEAVKKQFASLPAEIKNLVYSTEMMEIIKHVADKNQLHIDKIEPLEGEAVDVMTGFTLPSNFVKSLVDNLEIDQIKAETVAKDINELLFSKIRESMKKADLHVEEMPAVSNPPAVSAPIDNGKSVVMPSATKAAEAETLVTKVESAPVATPVPAVETPAPTALSTGSITIPSAPTTPVVTPAPAKPAQMPALEHVDMMLSTPTVSIAPKVDSGAAPVSPEVPKPAEVAGTEPPKPGPIYKTDPYHEPIE